MKLKTVLKEAKIKVITMIIICFDSNPALQKYFINLGEFVRSG